jgi:RNA polymerase sigma-70 factor (ECF subfamily)
MNERRGTLDSTAPLPIAEVRHTNEWESVPTVDPPRDDYASLFETTAPRLWRALYVYTGGRRVLAEEAVAEAFALVMERGSAVIDPEAWIFRTAFRIATNEMRRERRAQPAASQPEPTYEPEQVQDLMRALNKLPKNQRAAIVLHYREDLAVQEVASILGIKAPTVRVHLHRGRKKLRELLSQDEGGQQ